MDLKYIIEGGKTLEGSVTISGSKNAALPIIGATVLNAGITKLYNVPNIADVNTMLEILKVLGCRVSREINNTLIIDSKDALRV